MGIYEKLARYYDLLYNRTEDVPFIIELAKRHPGPILDAACGTGRMLLHLAREGHHVVGLDASSDMLARLRVKLEHEPEHVRRRVTLVQGDLRTFDLSRKFQLALVLYSAFTELPGRSDRALALTKLASHLETGGALVIDNFFERSSMHPGWGSAVRDGRPHHRGDYPSPDETGIRIRCYEAARFDPVAAVSTKDVILQYLEPDDTIRNVDTITATLYYATPEEFEMEVRSVGFRHVDQYGWFDFSRLYDPATAEVGRQITVATL
jgi:SAM-dependent methyltransferase